MRVLVVTPWYPAEGRPSTHVFVRDHSRAAATRHQVHVLHLDWNGGWADRPATPPSATRLHVPVGGLVGYVVSFALLLVGLVWVILRHGFVPQVIHGHVFKVAGHAWLASRMLKCPWVQTEHWSGFERGITTRRQLALAHWAYPRADRVLPVSRHLRDVMRLWGIVGAYEVVWNCVDTALFGPAGGRPGGEVRLLTVGLGSADNKNIGILLDALAALSSCNWSATIVGDSDLLTSYRHHAAQLGLAKQVHFTGMLPRSEVASLMKTHDLLVHPSQVETFSIAVAEALVSGLPVVACDTGAIRDMVEGTDGGYVVEDPSKILDGLQEAIQSLAVFDRNTISHHARKLLGSDRLADHLDKVYTSVRGNEGGA